MSDMAPTTGFGEVFQYSNHLVALGGYVAAKSAFPSLTLADAYDRVMRELVFEPLGMGASSLSGGVEIGGEARPHALALDGVVVPLADRLEHFVDAIAPAGAVWSSARDMAAYLAFELSGGLLPDGQRVMSAQALAFRRGGGVKITDREAYGLGLVCSTGLGDALVHHGGNTLGFTSDMFFLPDQQLGAVMLANRGQANGFLEAIRRRILELAFGLEDEAEVLMASAATVTTRLMLGRRERIQFDQSANAWLGQFCGDYHNSQLGGLSIRRTGTTVCAEFSDFKTQLGMDVRDTANLLALISPPFSGGLALRPTADRASLILASGQEEYAFQRL